MTSKSTVVTSFTDFYRAVNGDKEERHYTVGQREAARAFDAANDPVLVRGYGVYDTTVSSDYAVALYGSYEDAVGHVGAPAPAAPDSVIDEPTEEVPPPAPERQSATFGKRFTKRKD